MTMLSANGKILKAGQGGGGVGVILDFDFKNYPEPTFSGPYIIPNIGGPIFVGKSFNTSKAYLVDDEGLLVKGQFSSQTFGQSVCGFGFSKKVRFYQKQKGGTQHSSWLQAGLFFNGYINTNNSSRGMGCIVSTEVLAEGTLRNGFTANWGYTESSQPGSSMFIVPPTRLYPITDVTLESEIIFDLDNKSVTYIMNGVVAFEAQNVTEKYFYGLLQMVKSIGFYGGYDELYIERIIVESF